MPTFTYKYGQELYLEQGRQRKRNFKIRHWSAFLLLFITAIVLVVAVLTQFSLIGTDIKSKFSQSIVGFNETVTIEQSAFNQFYFYFLYDTVYNKDIWEQALKEFGLEDKKPEEALCELVSFSYERLEFLDITSECLVNTNCYVAVRQDTGFADNSYEVYLGFERPHGLDYNATKA